MKMKLKDLHKDLLTFFFRKFNPGYRSDEAKMSAFFDCFLSYN